MTSARNRVVVLAVLVTGMVAYALVSRKPTPEPLQSDGEAANSPAVAGLAATERSNRPADFVRPNQQPLLWRRVLALAKCPCHCLYP